MRTLISSSVMLASAISLGACGLLNVVAEELGREKSAPPAKSVTAAPAAPAEASTKNARQIQLGKRIEKPIFVEVVVPAGRPKTPFGEFPSCVGYAFGNEAQLQLTLERPIPGLVVRPLSSFGAGGAVSLRVEDRTEHAKWCPEDKGGDPNIRNQRRREGKETPTFYGHNEFHVGERQDGTFVITVGSTDGAEAFKVTLMIVDESTSFEPLAFVPAPRDLTSVEDRKISRLYPQLDVASIGLGWPAEYSERTAQLFKTVPEYLFVFAALDMDENIAKFERFEGRPAAFPHKNEPLLVMNENGDEAEVVAADGLEFRVRIKYLRTRPDGAQAPLAAPRALPPELAWRDVSVLAPPAGKALLTAFEQRQEKFDACEERVQAPYEKQLDSVSWTVNGASVESGRAHGIREASDRAVERQCGTEDKREGDKEATRVKMLAEIEKERVRLLAIAQQR